MSFLEPDLNNSLTAIAISNVSGADRSHFRHLPLIKFLGVPAMTAIKGRWGFYPCSYEVYCLLKRVNFLALQIRIIRAAWKRWSRKDPDNRVVWQHHQGGMRTKIGMMPEPFLPPFDVDPNTIFEDYRRARYPVQTESEVKGISLSLDQIKDLLEKLEYWITQKPSKQRVA